MMKFISKLKDEIKGYVAIMKPTTLNQAIVLARKQETMVDDILKKSNQQQKSNPNKNPYKPPNKNQPYKPAFKLSFKNRKDNPPYRRFLTEAKVKGRKENNLCYKCDEPYTPGHRCKIKHMYMLMSEEDAKAY